MSYREIENKSARAEAQALKAVRLGPLDLAPGLYIVSTPIGNLRDITIRALETLASVDLVLAEDTRTSAKLMNTYGLKSPLSAYHDHNAAKRIPNLINRIQNGERIALISDAGTPIVSDPGHKLVSACVKNGLDVIPVPGASAVLSALVTAGLTSDRFMFAGFLPPKSAARQTVLAALAQCPSSLIFYETAPRLIAALIDMKTVLGNRQTAICRELTKKYEQIYRGDLEALIKQLTGEKLRGEIVVVVNGPNAQATWEREDVLSALRARIGTLGVKRASLEVAEMSGHKKRDVYQWALKIDP